MKVLTDTKNTLLKRREIKIIVEATGNPGFEHAKKVVVDKCKASDDVIVVNNVKGKFGRDTFLIDAFVYDSKKDKEMIEPKPKVKKADGVAPAATPVAAPAPAATPAEVKK